MHVVLIERSQIQEYEFRVLADEIGTTGTFHPHRVARFAEGGQARAVVAVNGNYWRGEGRFGSPGFSDNEVAIPNQSVILEGNERVHPSGDNEWMMGFAPAGSRLDLRMFRAGERNRPQNSRYLHYALGSVGCVFEGARLCDDNLDSPRARSAIGYNDTQVVILSSDHGVSFNRRGARHSDLAWFFRAFGVTDALVLDGGSSAQLYVRGAGVPSSESLGAPDSLLYGNPVNPTFFPDTLFFGNARHVANALGLVHVRNCGVAEFACANRSDDDCDGLIDCDDTDCVGQPCSYCSIGTNCPSGTMCDTTAHECVPRAALDASTGTDGGPVDAVSTDTRLDGASVTDSGSRDASGALDVRLDSGSRMDTGIDTDARFDAAGVGVDTVIRPDTGFDASAIVDVMDVPPDGIPRPPVPSLNVRIPSDVTYHRTYDFTGPDTCTSCTDNPSDPYRTCVRPGFELDIERRATSTETSMWEARNYACALNSAGGYYDCFKNYNCIWNMDPLTGATCSYPLDGEMPSVTPTCQALPSIGIRMSIPSGVPGSYGYNMAVWPYEPSRPAFRVGSNVYVYAQFYLPTGQDVTARPGVDCTPSADPDRNVGGVHVPATTGPGQWHEVLIPLMATVGDFTTIRENLQNCNGWLQCMNSGIWPPNAGDALGGSCIVSRLEFAGYRDFCDLDRYDIELAVDDCAGCSLSHNLRAGSDWTPSERGALNGSTMTWRFRGDEVQQNCQLNRQFNVQLSSGEWMIDDRWAPVEPTHGTAILIRRRARWRYMNGSTVVSSVDVGCSMATPNHDTTGRTTLGHHGQMRITSGRVVATGMPDLPCEGP